MTRFRRIALTVAAGAGALALLGAATPAGATHQPTEPSLTGKAQLYRLDGQDVRFDFDVRGSATDAKGTFGFVHRDGDQVGWAKLKADCLITGGPVATVTGIVTDTNIPELKGKRKGVTVYDHGRHDRLGYSWAISHTVEVAQCLSMAPFETVRTGNFTVKHWFPPLPR